MLNLTLRSPVSLVFLAQLQNEEQGVEPSRPLHGHCSHLVGIHRDGTSATDFGAEHVPDGLNRRILGLVGLFKVLIVERVGYPKIGKRPEKEP